MADYKFQGWLCFDKDSAIGGMKWQEYEPKKFEETDVDIKITHCGICGTDLHILRSGWFPSDYPVCVGHEYGPHPTRPTQIQAQAIYAHLLTETSRLVGTIVKVGSQAGPDLQVGQTAGVGGQSGSCLDCADCASGHENYCSSMVATYQGRFRNGDKAYGGFADYWRGPAHFVVPIPHGMPAAEAGPMLCGGITLYAPLKKHGVGPGKRVGIVGIGGLGHFGILFAKALGADRVVALSRTNGKREDALRLGADEYVATDEDKDWAARHAQSLDLIISTVSHPEMPLNAYLSLLRTEGAFVQLGAPEDTLPAVNAFSLIAKGVQIGGSLIGPPAQIREMLDVAVQKGVHPVVQERPMQEANQAVRDMEAGKARYRFVLVNEKNLA